MHCSGSEDESVVEGRQLMIEWLEVWLKKEILQV